MHVTALQKFFNAVDQMTTEYEAEKGNITCEFCTNRLYIIEKMKYLSQKQVVNGKWDIYWCSTCPPDAPLHVHIVEFKDEKC